jgi:hypothetical protein
MIGKSIRIFATTPAGDTTDVLYTRVGLQLAGKLLSQKAHYSAYTFCTGLLSGIYA